MFLSYIFNFIFVSFLGANLKEINDIKKLSDILNCLKLKIYFELMLIFDIITRKKKFVLVQFLNYNLKEINEVK